MTKLTVDSSNLDLSRLRGRRILVTGGAGFIGSSICDALVDAGCAVTIVDNFRSGNRDNLGSVAGAVTLVDADILDYGALLRCAQGHDAICHQAAQLEITRALDDPLEDLRSNTVGMLNVLRAAKEAHVERVVYASSACVYGQAVATPQDEDAHPTDPNWAYGVSKLAAEKYASIYTRTHGLETYGLRYSIVYGPREWYGRVLTIFVKRALEGLPMVIFGDGRQVRDFVHVHDVVRMNLVCLADHGRNQGVFNVSTGVGTEIRALASLVREAANTDVDVLFEDVSEGQGSQHYARVRLPQELRSMVLSHEKAKVAFGWAPRIDLRDGLRSEIDWFLANRGRWTEMSY